MFRKQIVSKFLITALLVVAALMGFQSLDAALRGESELTTYVEIDGVNFGVIDKVSGLESFAADGYPLNSQLSYQNIELSREFVTEPSLYLWAKKRMSRKLGLQDIHLITVDENDNVVAHQILQLCQPLSWTVEAQSPALGGYNESIELAVQKITEL